MERHKEFYHLGRALCEAAEYYGIPLMPKKYVYHGLDKKMRFQSFCEFFNGPMSTTPEKEIGINVSRFFTY